MKGYQIFLHSVRQVFGNFGWAVRISGLLFLAQAVATLALGRPVMMSGAPGDRMMPGGGMILLVLVALVTSLWIVVAWHRFILRVEEPQTIVPPFHGQRLLAYLGYSLLIGVILIIPAAVLGALAGVIFRAGASGGVAGGVGAWVVASLIVLVPILLLSLRFSPLLPAAALGEPLGLRAAWTSTEGATLDFLALALIASVASIVIDLPMFLFMGAMPLALLWGLVTSWIKMMVGASILTTVYGHYVERRPLSV